jgi:hypothetical protein
VSNISVLPDGTDETETVTNFRLYGELGCNKVMYDYIEKGFSETWQCFGACFQVDEKYDVACVTRLQAAGYCVFSTANEDSESNGKVRVTMPFCKMFVDLLDKFNIPHPPLFFEGSFREMIKYSKEWMSSNKHEGLVVVVRTSPDDHNEHAQVRNF